jgi:predicted transcriptional regulator
VPQTVLEMTKDLVMAQIRIGALVPDNVQDALQHTYNSLMALKAQEETNGSAVVQAAPPVAADWRKSITRNTVTCLGCGATFKQLSIRHLREHDLDGRSYRAKYGIPMTQPLSARSVTAKRKTIAQRARPWEKAPTYLKAQEEKAEQAAPVTTRRTRRTRTARAKG